ncbi:hypothetical protein [Pseudoalteromonas sp. GB56]
MPDNILQKIEDTFSQFSLALESNDEAKANELAADFDALIKALSAEQIQQWQERLSELNETLIGQISQIQSQQDEVKKDLAQFSKNRKNLQAYNQP